MKKNRVFKKAAAACLSLGMAVTMLTGCSNGTDLASNGNDAPEGGYAHGTSIDGVPTFISKDGKLTSGQNAVQDVFYFAFDCSDLSSEAKAELSKHAIYLLKKPDVKVRVEGHTDERGSREYNVALGERRAQEVAKQLLSEGVRKDQVAIVSYGEEKPSVQGHDENAWKWNRRAIVAYEVG